MRGCKKAGRTARRMPREARKHGWTDAAQGSATTSGGYYNYICLENLSKDIGKSDAGPEPLRTPVPC